MLLLIAGAITAIGPNKAPSDKSVGILPDQRLVVRLFLELLPQRRRPGTIGGLVVRGNGEVPAHGGGVTVHDDVDREILFIFFGLGLQSSSDIVQRLSELLLVYLIAVASIGDDVLLRNDEDSQDFAGRRDA